MTCSWYKWSAFQGQGKHLSVPLFEVVQTLCISAQERNKSSQSVDLFGVLIVLWKSRETWRKTLRVKRTMPRVIADTSSSINFSLQPLVSRRCLVGAQQDKY
jgi:hypothetical protein